MYKGFAYLIQHVVVLACFWMLMRAAYRRRENTNYWTLLLGSTLGVVSQFMRLYAILITPHFLGWDFFWYYFEVVLVVPAIGFVTLYILLQHLQRSALSREGG